MIETAVFGGSFDPVHIEHIMIARATVAELGIKKLVVVPTDMPPHKGAAGASFADRVNMLKIAFKDFPVEVVFSDLEHRNSGKNYSSDNLPKLKKEYGDFYYVIGGDSLWHFETWHEPEFIARNFSIAVFNREGYADVSDKIAELNRKWDADFVKMDYVGKEVDSHTVRAKLNLQLKASGIPDGVYEYIKENDLYDEYAAYVSRLPDYVAANRIAHVKNTALMAININSARNLYIPYEKVFLAGILHDLGKKYDHTDVKGLFDVPSDSLGAVQHQFIGAILAEKDFGVHDKDILDAIRYHTTGRPAMTKLEKLIYSADMVSYERDYPAVDSLRQLLLSDFNAGFLACLRRSYEFLIEDGRKIINPLTIQAINYYEENK